MRVQVHLLPEHPHRSQLIETDEGPVRADEGHLASTSFSYRVGRIVDTSHPLTGEPISREEIAAALLEAARAEYPPPHYEVRLERYVESDSDQPRVHPETGEQLVDPDTGEAAWHKQGEWVPDGPDVESAPAGEVHEVDVTSEQGTEAEASA